ncbi:hypothetical protein B0H34DRAFT_215951 [Crassisporium funariophilum]|nr:hypothetical protein B0H34DRAFT_215951 [Crassisporium funariophilum]
MGRVDTSKGPYTDRRPSPLASSPSRSLKMHSNLKSYLLHLLDPMLPSFLRPTISDSLSLHLAGDLEPGYRNLRLFSNTLVNAFRHVNEWENLLQVKAVYICKKPGRVHHEWFIALVVLLDGRETHMSLERSSSWGYGRPDLNCSATSLVTAEDEELVPLSREQSPSSNTSTSSLESSATSEHHSRRTRGFRNGNFGKETSVDKIFIHSGKLRLPEADVVSSINFAAGATPLYLHELVAFSCALTRSSIEQKVLLGFGHAHGVCLETHWLQGDQGQGVCRDMASRWECYCGARICAA